MCVRIAKSDFVIFVCLLLCTTWVMNVVLFTIGTNFKKFTIQIQVYGGPIIVVTPSRMQQHAPWLKIFLFTSNGEEEIIIMCQCLLSCETHLHTIILLQLTLLAKCWKTITNYSTFISNVMYLVS
jgi:hypothetical protein